MGVTSSHSPARWELWRSAGLPTDRVGGARVRDVVRSGILGTVGMVAAKGACPMRRLLLKTWKMLVRPDQVLEACRDESPRDTLIYLATWSVWLATMTAWGTCRLRGWRRTSAPETSSPHWWS